MSQVPNELNYTRSHEWVRQEEDGSITVGITDHAQCLLGDLVFVELPELHASFGAGDDIAVVESVKTASDVYAPVSGTVTAVNEVLASQPEKVNQSPYDQGWLFKLTLKDPSDLADLLSADDYANEASK